MSDFFVNSEGGLTTAGYAASVLAAAVIFFLAVRLASRRVEAKRENMTARQLTFCAMSIALAYIASFINIVPKMPWGGSVTLCSMLFIVLTANWYGPSTGILVGFAYGILQFIQKPAVLSFFQVCCDYLLAFAALGVAGFFAKKSHGLLKGYIAAVFARGFFHTLGGYLYWMAYMPESFPSSLKWLYPVAYNYSYLTAEAVITIVIISIPSMAKALEQVKKFALE